MSKHKNLKRNLLICLLAGSAVMYTLPLHAATSVVANNALPTGGQFMGGSSGKFDYNNNGLELNVHQNDQNAVIKWGSFDVGGSATVNFTAADDFKNNFNTLNYVNSGSASQIYGTINGLGGNIYVVNTAGVQIGPSAQINVGSLYVSNNVLDDSVFNYFVANADNANFDLGGKPTTYTDAALMSLGNINANNVTFEGNGRIVIDSERIKNENTNLTADEIFINTNDKNNVVIGYEAYENGSYAGVDKTEELATLNGNGKLTKAHGYMWVEDVKQLQAIGENAETLTGNYALRNSIDATATSEWNGGNGFNPIGLVDTGKVVVHEDNKYGFTGNFDGIDYNIFGLNINQPNETNVGLFGVAHDANINNVTLVGGSITGGSVVGSVVGAALGNTHITNATNSASVTGNTDVGGIVGYSGDEISDGDNGNIIVNDTDSHFTNLVNTGTVHSNGENNVSVSNAGGLIGYMYNGTLDGNSYNLGNVSGNDYNVGGLVGHAVNSTIGDGTNLVYNRLDVTGAYNVGGIVGNMEGTAVQNAENSGNVLATGYRTEDYIYHTGETNKSNIPNNGSLNNGVVSVNVNVANVGGIAGKADDTVKADGTVDKKSEIKNVTNSGNVSSSKQAGNDYYDAGNVGGIVGSAVDTNITNATNKENEVRGAHNVGGVAGYFGNSNVNNNIKYTINRGINDGGDIMATGARKGSSFVTEIIRPSNDNQKEEFIIGNIGGIAGYMDGDNVYITGSGNRGTVHTDEPGDPTNVEAWQKAANVGGVVGKIDRSDTKKLDANNNIVDDYDNLAQAAVSDSYNTGDVLGYTGIGGIAGLMYNGEIASSYNLGYLRSTRQSYVGPATGTTEVVDALNMGGIVGDTTEESNATALLYDVYNKGQIGDKEFNYFGRHVGGVVGRLSGTVEKAYNTGAIYNGYNVVGGIAGWVAAGTIQNAFNTGNITVYNQNESTSQVGGIAGAANGGGNVLINNVYNLGTLRSFDIGYGKNAVAGILGTASGTGTVTIKNAYTTGNLYSGKVDSSGNFIEDLSEEIDVFNNTTTKVNSIYAATEWGGSVTNSNTYYIRPDEKLVNKGYFTDLYLYNQNNPTGYKDNSNKAIAFDQKSNINQYQYGSGNDHHSLTFTQQAGGDFDANGSVSIGEDEKLIQIDETGDWRIYDGNTPILNAFLPDSEKYFSNGLKDNDGKFTGTIQYGTAYDPLLTIINTNRDLAFNFGSGTNELSISNAAGIAVYGGGLTFNNFVTSSGTGYFGGTIYADGALNLNSNSNIGLGSAAQIYGSAVNINTDGKVTIYGDVTATGNIDNGAIGNKEYDEKLPNAPTEIEVENKGDISINAGDVDVYGKLTSATTADYGNDVKIPGIEGTAVTWNPGNVSDPYAEMSDIADRFAHTTGKSNVNGNITINAGKDKDGNAIGGGNVNIYFGNQEQGLITTGGDLQVEATGNIFVDSDLDVDGNLRLTSTGKNSEILLTLTNIGKVQADKFTGVIENFLNGKNIADIDASDLLKVIQKAYPGVKFTDAYAERIVAALKKYEKSGNKASAIEQLNNDIAVAYMHQFMHNFDKTVEGSNKIYLNADSGNAKLTVDMWDYNHNEYDFEKYDTKFDEHGTEHTFKDELDNLDLHVNNDTAGVHAKASEYVYVEVSNGAQLKAIQQAGADAALAYNYNYALMGDINASGVSGYEAIGAGSANGFTGTFDGRGNRIIGLKVSGDNAGIFSEIGTRTENINGEIVTHTGTVKNVNIYSGNFTGGNSAGAVAGVNSGRIENVTGFGNTVTVTGDANNAGNAGGIVGVNNGKSDFETSDGGASTLTGNGIYDVQNVGSVIAGGNKVVAGGLVGTNNGALGNSYSDSAVTSTAGTSAGLGGVAGVNTGDVQFVDSLGVTNGGTSSSSNVGGIIGVNNGNMYSGYNESIVSGKDKVGGIIGTNAADKNVENVVNATGVEGDNNVGGLVGVNSGSVTNGRNNGTITGVKYVGGMVGSNADEHSILANLTNDSSAAIEGENYVGGIAGTNLGTITAQNQSNLINRGSITGQNYVGGVAGENIGTIEYVKNDVNLYVKDSNETAKYFGGVAGINGRVDGTKGTITSATNEGDVVAENAQYVGGIVGWNTVNGVLDGMGNSNTGRVEGATYVGGVAGKNDAAITGTADNIITIENTGVVIAHNGGAGGIFGENTGDITYAEMSNSGIVSGTNYSGSDDVTNGTGGIIGVNSGDITYSSITNTVDGQVIGISNVGGLIGYNTGTIIGGRDEAQETDEDRNVTAEKDSYYKYQIYNNGVVNVGTWNDKNSNGKVDDGEITGLQQGETSQNIGGLIGNNADEIATGGKKGSLTAGYNTGVINAGSSTTVGGIAGSNSGTIDQVFNTVYNTDGTKGAITGGTNVGGLVGTNSGEISNAYNTTDVFGNTVFGNAVGNNAAKGTIENIYASNNSGKLIGENINKSAYAIQNAYSFVNGDTSATDVISGGGQKDSDSYADFDFTNGTWKNYDGSSNPLLKVFLTTLTVDSDKVDLVYNAGEQDLNIGQLVYDGIITAPIVTDNEGNEVYNGLDAYHNTVIKGNNLGESDLLQNTTGQKDAGTYDNWLYSGQIAGSTDGSFNPNNLGYDVVYTTKTGNTDDGIEIDKATINISLYDIYRTYGDIYNIYSDAERTTETTYDGSYTIDTSNLNDVLQQYIKDNLQVVELSSDGSLTGDGKTQNVGDYNWSLKFTLAGDNASNYQINSSDSVSDVVVTGEKKAHVEKANLTITLDEVIRNYGSTLITNNGGDYSATISGLVNGDDELGYTSDDLDITVTGDGALTGSSTGRVTNNAGDYTWSATVTGVDNGNLINLSNNYNITVNGTGKSTVKKVQLTVDLDEVTRTYGNTVITNNNGEYSISNIQGLVNGDADLGYDVDDLVINVTGDTALTGNSTGEVTQDANGDYTWSATVSGKDGDLTNLSTNYEIVTTGTGKSTVNKADLIININDVETTYGTAFDESKYGYGFGNNGANGLVNGDVLEDVKDAIDSAAGGYYNSGAGDGTNGKVTQDAEGDYSLSFNNKLTGTNTLKNYNIITVNNGDSTVNKKQITIGANDEQILVGETPNYNGTDIDSVLVNGDSLNGNYHYGVADGTIENVAGTHTGVIGVWIGGVFYDLSQNVDWTQAGSFFSNYEVNYTPGTLTVSAYDIPEDWPHNRWDYLFNDAPFDRNKDFRERKAEVNFVDGGMEI